MTRDQRYNTSQKGKARDKRYEKSKDRLAYRAEWMIRYRQRKKRQAVCTTTPYTGLEGSSKR